VPRHSALLTLAILAALAAGAAAAPKPGEKATAPPSGCGDAIADYADRLQVGPPRRHENLVLFPVFAEEVVVPDVALTFEEAMQEGLLEVCELKPARVNQVRLRSRAKEAIFLMGGEMLGGAKQDRIVGDDLIVPPGAELVIPVFCVERGRWVGKSESFRSFGTLAGSEVRKARQRADQAAVWENVAAEQARLNAPSATGALRSLQESEDVQEKVRPYARSLSDFAEDLPKARGVVACVGGEIIAADLFASRSLFQKLWPKLLEAYVVDAIGRPKRDRTPDAVEIKRWLEGVKRAERTPKDTPGDGRLYELRGERIMGSALVYDGGVVHIELFTRHDVRPLPFNLLEFRRERLEQR